MGKSQKRKVEIPPLDAVIGNPPYVEQEKIRKSAKGNILIPGTKEYYQKLVLRENGANLSGRSDLHCYFWPHSANFLKNDGYLCFLTSSQWLDTEYGFRLQDWILRNFSIIAIIESIDEPWFVGARVATTVTILQRESDEAARMNNTVRFVQLRRPVSEILAHDGTTGGAVEAADRFRDELLELMENTRNDRYRARLIRQGDLWFDGVKLSGIMKKTSQLDDEEEDSSFSAHPGEYYGGKWGVFLRAPDIWFELLDECGHNFITLGEIADVKRGVTTGKDSFFFPIDCSAECLLATKDPVEFEQHYGVSREEVGSRAVRLVRCGDGRGEIKPIESCWLEPEVHSLKEVDGFTVGPENCSRMILLVDKKKQELAGSYVLKYIQWGESNKFHTGPTCAARVTEEREWYDLTGHERAIALWPKERQYRHISPANDLSLIANCRLYEIYPHEEIHNINLWGGILNSSFVLLSSLQFGRPVGNEGAWSTMVSDVNMMLVPNPIGKRIRDIKRVAHAFDSLKRRKALMFLSERRRHVMDYTKKGKQDELDALSDLCELDMTDRRELDDAVLEMIGVESPERRQEMIDELYSYLREFFEATRQKEEKAIINKNKAKRHGPARPEDIAAQIHKEISENEPLLLRRYETDFLDTSQPFDTQDLPTEGSAENYSDMFVSCGVIFLKKGRIKVRIIEAKGAHQVELLKVIANSGTRGLVRVPHESEEAQRVLREYAAFLGQRKERILELVEERTADEEMQEKVYSALMVLLAK